MDTAQAQDLANKLRNLMDAENLPMSGSHAILSNDEVASGIIAALGGTRRFTTVVGTHADGKFAVEEYGVDSLLHNLCLLCPGVIEPVSRLTHCQTCRHLKTSHSLTGCQHVVGEERDAENKRTDKLCGCKATV